MGANCTIICGVTIGEYAFIGAGSVVTKDVLDNMLVVGNPARIIRTVSNKGEIMIVKANIGDGNISERIAKGIKNDF